MTKPTLLLSGGGKQVPTLVKADGTPLWPLAIGTKSNTYDDAGGWAGIATHENAVIPGANDGYVAIAGFDGSGSTAIRRALVDATGQQLVDVARRRVKIAVTPTISSGAIYAAKDAIGALLTFASAGRTGILTGLLEGVAISDKGQQMAALDLVLFSATFTAPTDNAVFDPTDAELLTIISVVHFATTDYYDFNDNSVGYLALNRPYVLAGTAMYGALVSRGTPTYTSTTDLTVSLLVRTD